MDKNEPGQTLDNKTITKLAIAIATAIHLKEAGEVVGPLTRKVLDALDTIDSSEHFVNHVPRERS
jgi:hypothetical protein